MQEEEATWTEEHVIHTFTIVSRHVVSNEQRHDRKRTANGSSPLRKTLSETVAPQSRASDSIAPQVGMILFAVTEFIGTSS
jgi:hypothetical protein